MYLLRFFFVICLLLLADHFHKGRDQMALFADISQALPIYLHIVGSQYVFGEQWPAQESLMCWGYDLPIPYFAPLGGRHKREGKRVHFS